MGSYSKFIKFNVGDKVRRLRFAHSGMNVGDIDKVAPARFHGQDTVDLEEFGIGHSHYNLELVESAPLVALIDSPIRTTTKREIVCGRYGIVDLDAVREGIVAITVDRWNNAAELRAAAKTLTEIADYLEAL